MNSTPLLGPAGLAEAPRPANPLRIVLCIALFRQQAEDIMHRLELHGISDSQISVIFPEKGIWPLPGIGPFIAAGPIVASLEAAVLLNTSCQLASGLMGMGVPKDKAMRYQRKIEGGHFLVSVHAATSADLERSRGIFAEMAGMDITSLDE